MNDATTGGSLSQVRPPSRDRMMWIDDAWPLRANSRQVTYTVPSSGAMAIMAPWLVFWLSLIGDALKVCPQSVDRANMIFDGFFAPLPSNRAQAR